MPKSKSPRRNRPYTGSARHFVHRGVPTEYPPCPLSFATLQERRRFDRLQEIYETHSPTWPMNSKAAWFRLLEHARKVPSAVYRIANHQIYREVRDGNGTWAHAILLKELYPGKFSANTVLQTALTSMFPGVCFDPFDNYNFTDGQTAPKAAHGKQRKEERQSSVSSTVDATVSSRASTPSSQGELQPPSTPRPSTPLRRAARVQTQSPASSRPSGVQPRRRSRSTTPLLRQRVSQAMQEIFVEGAGMVAEPARMPDDVEPDDVVPDDAVPHDAILHDAVPDVPPPQVEEHLEAAQDDAQPQLHETATSHDAEKRCIKRHQRVCLDMNNNTMRQAVAIAELRQDLQRELINAAAQQEGQVLALREEVQELRQLLQQQAKK